MLSPMTQLVMGVAALMAHHIVDAVEECSGRASCPAQTSGPSMLQTVTHTSKVHETVFGVPVLMEKSMGTFSLLDEEERDWVLVTKVDQKTEATVHQLCQAAKNCTGEELALGLTTLHGTKQELMKLVEENQDEIESIETDVWGSVIPDFPDDEIDASLLEARKVDSWGLDRIDDRRGLDNSYNAPAGAGRGIHVYVMDTGIRTTHNDFGGRAIPTLEIVGNGVIECKGDRNCADDKHGHGTHCAGTVGGSKFGVAKEVTLHAVKIFGDSGNGPLSWFTQGLDWIVSEGERPAVVSASMEGEGQHNYIKQAVDRTVNNGVVVVVAAGNSNTDSCRYSPAYVPSAINVGATQNNDKRAKYSNYGTCLDIFAPGHKILSAGHKSNTATNSMKGTSMACPHVAGAAALLLQNEPNLTPKAIADRIISSATKNVVTSPGNGSPNKLLYVGGGSTPPQTTAAPPQTTAPPTQAPCIDHSKCATKWKNKCNRKIVLKNCPRMCGTCSGGTPPPEECKNKHPKCTTKWLNKCNRQTVKNNCPLMCGLCTP